jgi:Zn finger protein HypA/HybF involved in hydrogenase expression
MVHVNSNLIVTDKIRFGIPTHTLKCKCGKKGVIPTKYTEFICQDCGKDQYEYY